MKIYIYLVIVFFFTSCGGGGSSSSSNSSNTQNISLSITGKVVDGYIKNAAVCLDININGLCDSGEPNTNSLEDGSFSFSSITLEKNKIYPIISIGGVDTSTNEQYIGELKSSIDTSNSVFTTIYINPLSDLNISAYLNSSSKDSSLVDELKNKIESSFSLSNSNISENPMENRELFAKAQEIEYIKSILQTSIKKIKNRDLNNKERNSIKLSIVSAINSSNNLVWEDLLTEIERAESITIEENEKTFLINQFTSNKASFNSLSSSSNVNISSLSSLQNSINEELKLVHDRINNSNYSVVNLSSTDKLISKAGVYLKDIESKSYDTPPNVPDFR